MEHLIGTRITLEVVERDDCEGCFFRNHEHQCEIPKGWECHAKLRTDHKNIIYKEIKWGKDMNCLGCKHLFYSIRQGHYNCAYFTDSYGSTFYDVTDAYERVCKGKYKKDAPKDGEWR